MATLLTATMLCGCSHTDKSGVRTHLIIGFGLVRVSNTNEAAGSVISVKALGLHAGNGNATVGWVNQTCVAIKTNSNVLLEIKR
jgi:hypothetical protein